MSDNYTVKDSAGADQTFAAKDVGGTKVVRHILVDESNAAVSPATAAGQTSAATLTGAVTETAPASDTASSGLNGRLQRLAQRLTTLIGLLPAAIGPTAKAGALSTTTATDDPLISQTGIVTETAPASDTASSGLNGRLQRLAQRLTTLITGLPTPETTATPAAVVLVAATAKDLLAANSSRIRATIYNPLAASLYVRKATLAGSAATAAAGGYDFVIPNGAHWMSDPKEWAGGYNGICAVAGSVNVSETV